jgi:peptide/nickel transport system permease protein
VLFLVTLATFLMLELVPGDPAVAVLGPDATAKQYAAVRAELGLDEPLLERYVDWLGGVLTGDLGTSLEPPGPEVADVIGAALPVTVEVAALSILMALGLAIPTALLAARRPGSRVDRAATSSAYVAISTPSFLAALVLVFFLVFRGDMVRWIPFVGGLVLAGWLLWQTLALAREPSDERDGRRIAIFATLAVTVAVAAVALFIWFPSFPRQGFVRLSSGEGLWENLRHAFLPALTLAILEFAVFMRLLRGDLISTLQEDFILAARAKGMPTWRILVRDALRPSSFSMITVAGIVFGRLIGGTVIVETVFNLPGMGRMIVDAIYAKDFPVVQGGVLVIAVLYVLVNAAVDISYAYLDPRIRRGAH